MWGMQVGQCIEGFTGVDLANLVSEMRLQPQQQRITSASQIHHQCVTSFGLVGAAAWGSQLSFM